MKRSHWILLLAACLIAIVTSWLWLAVPKAANMASYAPADSLLFLETDDPLAVVEAVGRTEAWKILETSGIVGHGTHSAHWLRTFMRWTGIGPAESVILARAQVAVVVTELRTAEEAETLNIKPEGAIVIETHTAQWRIRPAFEKALQTLAEKTYGTPTNRRVVQNGFEYVEWIAPENSRQIVGVVSGSLIVIGTSEQAVQNCLGVSLGQRASLKSNAELQQMATQLDREHSLTFGYVPRENSAKLLSVGLPVLLGRAPGDSDFQRLIAKGAAKVFGSLGWSSRPYSNGIEDRYLITLEPAVVARLKPAFAVPNSDSRIQQQVPRGVYSVTFYKFANAGAAWQSLKTAVSSEVDALSSIVFSSLLKSALLSYGVEEPETLLEAVDDDLFTVRVDDDAEHSILVAGVRDRPRIRAMVAKNMSVKSSSPEPNSTEFFENSDSELAVSLSDRLLIMGSKPEVRRYAEFAETGAGGSTPDDLKRITVFDSSSNSANVVTYTNDGDRVRGFLAAIMRSNGTSGMNTTDRESAIAKLPYSVTVTTLQDSGLERITRSPLGQFSTLLPLLFPEKPGVTKR
ncbi:MAG TPA: hypothetical protein VK208_01605 [Pyrinomonadaceae bacterium]|jgi:hypothetical protein|nr:hypothetical protein [Pyrinomonadaceae bacterium]